MLPRHLQIKEIDRFHEMVEKLSKRINEEQDVYKKGVLAIEYYKLTEFWIEIDDFIENRVKATIDNVDEEYL